MRVILAILLPPVAVWSCGRFWAGFANLLLTLLTFWIGGVIHALFVVGEYNADKRMIRQAQLIANATR